MCKWIWDASASPPQFIRAFTRKKIDFSGRVLCLFPLQGCRFWIIDHYCWVTYNEIWTWFDPKLKKIRMDCLKLRSVSSAGIRTEQAERAGMEEGTISGSSLWSRKRSEPKCRSFVHLWKFFSQVLHQKQPDPLSRGEVAQSVSNLSHDNKRSVLMPISQGWIPRMMCKRRRVCLLTVLTDWKWHQLASTPQGSQQSRS